MNARAGTSSSPLTRPSLLLRIRGADNQQAQEGFVDLYTPLIFGFCRNRRLQEADAVDVAQGVMRAVSRARTRFGTLLDAEPNGRTTTRG